MTKQIYVVLALTDNNELSHVVNAFESVTEAVEAYQGEAVEIVAINLNLDIANKPLQFYPAAN